MIPSLTPHQGDFFILPYEEESFVTINAILMNIIDCTSLPDALSSSCAYRLLPIIDPSYYKERTDRNIGWITLDEQNQLRESVIGIAGCGGMGGLLASIFVRLGVGEVRIADSEVFDASNINRQFGAGKKTIGKSKAVETANLVRNISNDTTLVVYAHGIQPDTVESFLDGCDVVCDEIEFWAIGSRILLHQEARKRGIGVFNCNTVGFGTRLFFFDPEGYTMEETLGYGYAEAQILQNRIQKRQASDSDIHAVMNAVISGLVPEIPEYSAETETWKNRTMAEFRLFTEGRAMIIATNPPMASGFVANHVLFYLLRNSTVKRVWKRPEPMPGYLYFDAGLHVAKSVSRCATPPAKTEGVA